MAAPMLTAVTLDFWDTLYSGATTPERIARRRTSMRTMLDALEVPIDDARLTELYVASGAETERWWREEQRGYTAGDRIRWLLGQLAVERPEDCQVVARAVAEVDDALLELPPPLLPGAREMVVALAEHFPLAIISDTGFASGRAQDRLLAQDGLLHHFLRRVYSCDVGHAKPHPEPFRRAIASLGVHPSAVLHVGDIERTDVRGALDAGFRAVRLDVVRRTGPSAAELVATSFDELTSYLLREA